MLKERNVEFHYREYTEEPLSEGEIRKILQLLHMSATDVLRKNDKAYKENGLTGGESEDELIKLMATHPTLLQRPIGVIGDRAVLGRPHEHLLSIV